MFLPNTVQAVLTAPPRTFADIGNRPARQFSTGQNLKQPTARVTSCAWTNYNRIHRHQNRQSDKCVRENVTQLFQHTAAESKAGQT